MQKGFTLLELLIVIAILAILTTAVILVMNPAESIKRARDTQRISDLDSLKTAIILYVTEGNANISATCCLITHICKSSTCCNPAAIPCAAACTDSCDAGKTSSSNDGEGWIPINFTGMAGGSPLSHLPIDPVNAVTNNNYYYYAASSTDFELATRMESAYYHYSTGKNKVGANDGGNSGPLYEVGTKLDIFECAVAGASSPDCADESTNTTCTNGVCVAP